MAHDEACDMRHAHLDESGQIATDLPCLRCGYNLRTLAFDGRCPECGAPVERSVRGDLLGRSDPKWVHSLAGGVNWLLATLLAFLLGISSIALSFGLRAEEECKAAIVVSAIAVVSLSAIVSFWKLTAPEPDLLKCRSSLNAGFVARRAAFFFCLLIAFDWFLIVSDPVLDRLSHGVVYLAFLGTVATFLIHLQRLAARLPMPGLARRTRLFMWLFVAMMACYLIGTFVPLLLLYPVRRAALAGRAVNPLNPLFSEVGDLLVFAAVLGAAACVPFAAVLILRYRQAFLEAARRARATSTGERPPA